MATDTANKEEGAIKAASSAQPDSVVAEDGFWARFFRPFRGSWLEKLELSRNAFLIILALAVLNFVTISYLIKNSNIHGDNITKVAIPETLEGVIAKVSELLVLPSNEQPTLATVSDPELLKNQAFFANAKKGDKVLIYSKSGKAILYDPISNKIVEVAPINLDTTNKTKK